MVKKIHIVRKSRRRSRRRSRRKSKKNKKSNRRSRRKSNTKKLKGGSAGKGKQTEPPPTPPPGAVNLSALPPGRFARPGSGPRLARRVSSQADPAADEEGDIIMTLKEYLIPHGGIGKPEVIQETSYSMSLEEQTQILNQLQKDESLSASDNEDFVIINPMNKGGKRDE